MNRILFSIVTALVMSSAVSCEVSDDDLDKDGNEVVDGGNEDAPGDDDSFSDYLISVGPDGLTDENMLQYCVSMTHQYKYDIAGLEDCTWARVRYVQNLDGNDWTPLLTVDPNETGKTRSVKIEISLDAHSWHCEHELRQAP